jgi:hypothetical protein
VSEKKWRRKKSEPASFSDSVTILQRYSPVVEALSSAIRLDDLWQRNSEMCCHDVAMKGEAFFGNIGSLNLNPWF